MASTGNNLTNSMTLKVYFNLHLTNTIRQEELLKRMQDENVDYKMSIMRKQAQIQSLYKIKLTLPLKTNL